MTLKVLEENEGECFYDLKVGKDFLNTTPEAQTINEKINTFDCIKIFLKHLCKYIKDINKVKNTNLRLGEDIWHAHNQERIWPRIYKQLQWKRPKI